MREGRELIGYGMATGIWEAFRVPQAPAWCSRPTARSAARNLLEVNPIPDITRKRCRTVSCGTGAG
jgi:hypothetical protein